MPGATFSYEIRVEGLIDGLWADWFEGMTITYANDLETILTGELQDQTALHGVLARIRDLGLNLISVRRVDGNQDNLNQSNGFEPENPQNNGGYEDGD